MLNRYDEASLSEWLGGVPREAIRRLAGSGRFARRLEAIVEDRLGPMPVVLPADCAAVLALDGDALQELALRAGAVWHGRAISQAISGSAVRSLIAAIGAELRQLGLEQGWRRQGISAPFNPEQIASDLQQDGQACLHAWCRGQPPSVGRRVALRLPPLPEPDDEHLAIGPGIIAALCGIRDGE